MADKYKFSNQEVVKELKEVLAAMEIKNVGRFRIRAYDNAIASLDNLTISIRDLWEDGRLNQIPGVGASLAQHIDELFTNGQVWEWENIKEDLPAGMFSLIGLRGIGAKKAFKLASAFKLHNRETAVEDLKKAAEGKKIQILEGFGEKSETDILEAVEYSKKTKSEKPRMLLVKAEDIAGRVIAHMNEIDCIEKIEFMGSYRRRNPTVGDLDLVVATKKADLVIQQFLKFPEISEVLAQGENKVMVVLSNEAQVDLRISRSEAYGAMLQYNTGNVQHNINLRTKALEKGLSLSEYGIKNKKTGRIKEFSTEEDFYKFLGLQYIPPELRYGYDEIELAAKNKLPKLVQLSDIKGDIHTHTVNSDGSSTIEEMVTAGLEYGYEYYGISDHSPSVQSRGFDEVAEIIQKTRKEIDKANKSQSKMKVFFGYEVNILADATLSLPNELLKELDYVIAGIHSAMRQDRDMITKRIVAALENEYVTSIAHPLNRIINKREACDINWPKVLDAAKANNKILEIDAQPDRLDLSDDLVKQAINRGIKVMISTDAHDIQSLGIMKYGIDVARRGWCEALDVVNTYSLKDFMKELGIFK